MVKIIDVLSPDLVVLTNGGSQAIWSKIKLRKPTRCVLFDTPLRPGDEAWRPIGNQQYRWNRLSMEGMRALLEMPQT